MRYFLGFLVSIGLLILLIVILVSGGDGKKTEVEQSKRPLSSYANTDAAAIMTIDGPVNAAQTHSQMRITVTKNQVLYEQIRGYDGAVEERRSYGNTTNAYTAFLKSIALAGYTNGDTESKLKDERGYCPLGNRYIFELTQGTSDIQRFWTTECNKEKTYLGDRGLTVELFRLQVPDFNQIQHKVSL